MGNTCDPLTNLAIEITSNPMIEAILEQVEHAVDRFVAKNPLLRNDRDDLVQDTFLKILPRMNGENFPLAQCRAFAHKATFWTCQTALRKISQESRKNRPLLSDQFVYYQDGEGLPGPPFIDWDRIGTIVEQNDALFTWFEVETDSEIRDMLYEQIEAKLEFLIS